MNKIRLIAIDIDGTLVDDDDEISPKTIDVLGELKKRAYHIVLCTGRTLEKTKAIYKQLHLNDYIVVSNGGEIYQDDRLIQRKSLHPAQVESLYRLAQRLQMEKTWIETQTGVSVDELPDLDAVKSIIKFGCHSFDQEKLARFQKEAEAIDTFDVSSWHESIVEYNPIGVNKLSAIQKICEREGLSLTNVLAIGDNNNDLKLHQAAGYSVAMGNAIEEIKVHADFITGSNNESGLAFALEKLMNEGEEGWQI